MAEWPLARALGGEVVRGEEFLYERGDGTRFWIRVSAAPETTVAAGVPAGQARSVWGF